MDVKETGVQQKCYCGGEHSERDCRFKNEKCHACSKIGHIAHACRKGKVTSHTQYVETEGNASRIDEEAELFGVYAVYSTLDCEKDRQTDRQTDDFINPFGRFPRGN